MFSYYFFSLLSSRAPGGHVKTKGTIYLSNIRMVFVANKPVGNFFAFDMPLVSSSIQVLLLFSVYFVVLDTDFMANSNLPVSFFVRQIEMTSGFLWIKG
jgi:hypothetical protein